VLVDFSIVNFMFVDLA